MWQMMRVGFINWRRPALLASVYYRITRLIPALRNSLGRLPYELHTRSGTILFVRAQDLDAPAEVFGNDEYLSADLNWSEAQFVLDLGAHIGSFTLWLAERSQARVYCVEPNPDTFERLSRNVYGLRASGQAILRQAAIGGSSGRMPLILAANSGGVRLGSRAAPGAHGRDDVDVMTLEQALAYSGFPRVDIVKMDIEGSEYSVLEATSRTVFHNISRWVIECHLIGSKDGTTAARLLQAAGYEVALKTKPSGMALLVAKRRSDDPPHSV